VSYLITGGCGFLGSNIAAELLRRGCAITILDNLAREGSSLNLEWLRSLGKFEFIHGDVRNAGDCYSAVKKSRPAMVFHLAGQVAMTTSISNPRLDFEVNAVGSLNILEAVREHSTYAGVIYSSTNKVYGDLESLRYAESSTRYELKDYPNGLPETIGLDFRSPYGCSKGSADQYMMDYARNYGINTVVFRHSSMFGGRQYSSIDQGWIGWFCEQAMKQADGRGVPFTISGNGKQVRDVLFADDMVSLYLRAADEVSVLAGEVFNIGGGIENSLSILELMDILADLLGIDVKWTNIEPRQSDQRVFVADIEKINRAIGWYPVIGKNEGIRRMISWIKQIRN
jgi:CDP-paratose 2-epimerase